MSKSAADRNLLFGLLAMQMDFIAADVLIGAMDAWVVEKQKPLGEILVARGALDPHDRAMLESMVDRHVQIHGGDAAQSLAALGSATPVREALRALADGDLQASLGHLAPTLDHVSDADPERVARSFGAATSAEGRFRILRLHDRGGLG